MRFGLAEFILVAAIICAVVGAIFLLTDNSIKDAVYFVAAAAGLSAIAHFTAP